METKKDDIILLEKAIDEGEKINFENYKKDLEEAIKMNKRFEIIEFLFKEEKKEKKKTEKEFNQMAESFNSIEKMIKDNRFKKLKKNIKTHLMKFFSDNKNIKYLLEIFTQEQIDNFLLSKDTQKISDENINKLNIILEYYNNYYSESKTKEINEIKDIIKNNKNNYEQYIKDFDFEKAKNMNLRYPLIKLIFDNSKDKVIDNAIKTWNFYEDMIKKNRFKKMPITYKNILIGYFNEENNKERLIEIFGNDTYKNFKNTNINSKEKKKLKEDIINNLIIVLKYYKNYLFESKKEEIIFLEKAIQKGEEFEYKKYLENLEENKIMNDKYPLIEFIYNWNNKGKTKTEEEIKNTLKSYNTAEKAIKDKRTNKLKNYLKEPLKEFFNNKDNHQI